MKTPSHDFDACADHEDEALMKALLVRDHDALRELYERHCTTLRGVIMRVLHDEADSEEVLQEVFAQCWERAQNYREQKGKPLGWLITLARRRSIDRLRQRASYHRTNERYELQCRHEHMDTDDHTVEREAATDDLQAYLKRLMGRLPVAQREVIDHCFFQGMSQRRIAQHLHVPLGTVKTRIELGLRKLSSVVVACRSKIV